MIAIEVLRKVQKQLSHYIFSKGFLSWDGIRKVCKRIILALPEKEQQFFVNKSYPEFEIFIPLLRNGSAEVCKSKNRASLLFCMNPNINLTATDHKECIRGQEYFSIYKTKDELDVKNLLYQKTVPCKPTFEPMDFLKNFPSIHQQISSFSEKQIQSSALMFQQNLMNYQYEKKKSENTPIGIYKINDYVWSSSYLIDKDTKIRKIPYYAEDPDAMNLARLYVRTHNEIFTKPIFEYDKDSQELTCNKYSEMPILLTRALLLFEPVQLTSKAFCTNHPSVPFRKVPEDAIKELKRIFSDRIIAIQSGRKDGKSS